MQSLRLSLSLHKIPGVQHIGSKMYLPLPHYAIFKWIVPRDWESPQWIPIDEPEEFGVISAYF